MVSTDWTIVIAHTDVIAVRVLLAHAAEAEDFTRWMRANGWFVRSEPTSARNPGAVGRYRDEEDLAAGLVVAYKRWVKSARHRTMQR